MAQMQTGVAIHIKAFLPTGKTIEEQFKALSIVKDAHESGDYCTLLTAATIEEVKTETKTRRQGEAPATEAAAEDEPATEQEPDTVDEPQASTDDPGPTPEFLKKGKQAA